MYKIYDISMPIFEGMPVYKNNPEKQPSFGMVHNDYVTETRISLDVHTGTHVDAPLHMVVDGKTTESIPIDKLVGPCKVLDLTEVNEGITTKDLENKEIEDGDFLLFKTKNSKDTSFNPDFIYVKEDAAEYLVRRNIKGVGIDALGVERSQPGHPTHKKLFAAGILVIEGLKLGDVPEGSYFLIAAPLHLKGLDASPARVLLLDGLRY